MGIRHITGTFAIILAATLSLTVSFSYKAEAGPVPCLILLKDSTNPVLRGAKIVKDAAVKSAQLGLRGAKILTLDRAINIEKAVEIKNSIPDTPEARQAWMADFRERAAEGIYKPVEVFVYMELASPTGGKEITDLFDDGKLVFIRKKFNLNPLTLLRKLKPLIFDVSESKKASRYPEELTAKEKFYLNAVKAKEGLLFGTKTMRLPRKISSVDNLILSIMKAGIKFKVHNSNTEALFESVRTYADVNFENKIAEAALHLDDGDSNDPVVRSAFKTAATKMKTVLFKSDLKAKKIAIEYIDDIENPERAQEIYGEVTPLEKNSFHELGEMGLLQAMIKEKGETAAYKRFAKMIIFNNASKWLFRMSILAVIAKQMWVAHTEGAGAAISMIPDPNSSPKPFTKQENSDIVINILAEGNFDPLVPEVLNDRADPSHPDRNPSPCDPEHKIRDKADELRKSGFYKDDDDILKRNPDLAAEWITQIQHYAEMDGSDKGVPNTGCKERFVEAWLSQM